MSTNAAWRKFGIKILSLFVNHQARLRGRLSRPDRDALGSKLPLLSVYFRVKLPPSMNSGGVYKLNAHYQQHLNLCYRKACLGSLILLVRIKFSGIVLFTLECDVDEKVSCSLSVELHLEQISRSFRQPKDHVSHAQGGFSYLQGAMPNRVSSVHSQQTSPTDAA